ncbi:low temperature requirement protein A [Streptomyces cavernae]|uniref:low temperature requirement protein A n=1 Tax=Streptomyces cavernae TaxID=2259034 RepID=UPI001EE4599E|nr:low temperature requirement protein A [Streptomyces cavernae]
MNQSPYVGVSWFRPMLARLSDEEHRTATTLELFFDLCFVAAVAQVASAFEHELSEGRIGQGVLSYVLVFFAIWWAWMNFTWFASAYDTDDVLYRVITLVQITGALVMAAGAARALEHGDWTVITWGYVVMRLAMASQWLRAAYCDHERRRCCLRYAFGILVAEIGWVAAFAVPGNGGIGSFLALAVIELAIPLWAEHAANTTWHPHHIAERYGLFTLIVLGESVIAASSAVRTAWDADVDSGTVALLALGGLLTVFSLWWLYFNQDAPRRLTMFTTAMVWGYGHYALFASAAATGAGLALNVARVTGHGTVTDQQAAAMYTIPVAVFIALVRLLHRHASRASALADIVNVTAVIAVLGATFTAVPVLSTGIIAGLLITATLVLDRRGAVKPS